jgi:class 3 adenylate cyclase
MKINSIRIKIIALIFLALSIIITASLYISVTSQQQNLVDATSRTLSTNTEILNKVVRNLMLNGEAPIAVNTMKNLREIGEFKTIAIYRIDGTNAFNDYQTVEYVNRHQNQYSFQRTPRIEKKIVENPNFKKVLETSSPLEYFDPNKEKSIEYFFPILNNQNECHFCHGTPPDVPFIRGVAHFKISVAGTYEQINRSTLLLTFVFAGIGAAFTIILIFFMRGLIILPLQRIGGAVKDIGEGNLDARVNISNRDELGELASKINDMIKGLNERFHLSKYVSRSTENLIVSGGTEDVQSEKKRITVLFSDIRGFTSYTESQEPETVISELNSILEAQTEIVEKYGGDIDKFVGDELMAVFEDEFTAVRCAVDLVKAVYALNKKRTTELFIGAGINCGDVVAGNIGSRNRMEYAVIGDTVNLASRLCNIAKKNMILITAAVYENVKDRVETQLVANQKIKGKAEAVDVYAVKGIKPGISDGQREG